MYSNEVEELLIATVITKILYLYSTRVLFFSPHTSTCTSVDIFD